MKKYVSLVACFALLVFAGCTEETPTATQSSVVEGPAVDGSMFLLADEPEGATTVIQVRKEAEDGDDVVLVGRIGGGENPWIDGRAAFSLVDDSLTACSDIPGDNCPNPWDYCCQTDQLPKATALVKIVDDSGSLVKADAKRLLDVKELSTVVVQGKAQRDDAGNLTVLASGVYVKQK